MYRYITTSEPTLSFTHKHTCVWMYPSIQAWGLIEDRTLTRHTHVAIIYIYVHTHMVTDYTYNLMCLECTYVEMRHIGCWKSRGTKVGKCRHESGSKEAEVGNIQARSRETERARIRKEPPRNSRASCKFTWRRGTCIGGLQAAGLNSTSSVDRIRRNPKPGTPKKTTPSILTSSTSLLRATRKTFLGVLRG